MRVLLTGGGTGGHIYPALAILDYFKEYYDDVEFLFVGTNNGLESNIVPNLGIPFKTIKAEGFSRNSILKTGKAFLITGIGILQSYKIIKNFKPDVVIGTGGYVCGPVVLIAATLKIPTVIHEQNAFPGITNKFLARYADTVCLTYKESEKYFKNSRGKIVVTGLPVRKNIIDKSRIEGQKKLGLKNKLTILIMGGSRGAKSINKSALKVIDKLKSDPEIQIILITGQAGYEETKQSLKEAGVSENNNKNVLVKPYISEMEYVFAVADLVVSRAGATVLAEITAKGLPAILVPYPYAAENHQEFNARALVQAGAAKMILDKDINGHLLLDKIEELVKDTNILKAMGEKSKQMGKINSVEKIRESIADVMCKVKQ